MKTVRIIKSALVGLVALCVLLRVLAWLVTPILPAVATLLIVVIAVSLVLSGIARA